MRAFIIPNGCSTVSRRWRKFPSLLPGQIKYFHQVRSGHAGAFWRPGLIDPALECRFMPLGLHAKSSTRTAAMTTVLRTLREVESGRVASNSGKHRINSNFDNRGSRLGCLLDE
jgi:hypothetical protein